MGYFLLCFIFNCFHQSKYLQEKVKIFFRLLEVIENEPTNKEVAVNEFRQKFSTSVNGGGGDTKMEIDDNNSMKVNTTSRQSSATAVATIS